MRLSWIVQVCAINPKGPYEEKREEGELKKKDLKREAEVKLMRG